MFLPLEILWIDNTKFIFLPSADIPLTVGLSLQPVMNAINLIAEYFRTPPYHLPLHFRREPPLKICDGNFYLPTSHCDA